MVEKAGRDILDRLVALEEQFHLTHDDMLHPELGMPVFDSAADAVVVVNEKLEVVLINKVAEELFGADLIGKTVHSIINKAVQPDRPIAISFTPVKSAQGTLIMTVLREGKPL